MGEYLQLQTTLWFQALGRDTSPEHVHRHLARHDLLKGEVDELVSAVDDPDRFLGVMDVGGELAGAIYVEIRPDRYLCEEIGVLSWIYVDRRTRRRRVGARLLAESRAWLTARSIAVCEVFSTRSNEPAAAFYDAAGFGIVDDRRLTTLR